MNLLERGSRHLDAVRNRMLAVTILYNDEPVRATVGKTVFRLDRGYGIIYEESTDFLISAALLDEPPAKGDRIRYREDEFEVLAPDGEKLWRWTDGYQTTCRIHTKKVN